MRRVIRNRAGLYWKGDGAWTADWEQAQNFADTQKAIFAKENHHLKDVDLVILVNDKPSREYDVVLPLKDARP